MMTITLLGTGSHLPSAHRAGPSTLVSAQRDHFLVDAGRGVLMRLVAAGVSVSDLSGVLLTHLHGSHLTDLNDVITTWWVETEPQKPLEVVGPRGSAAVVDHIMRSLGPDIAFRRANNRRGPTPPEVNVTELDRGPIELSRRVAIAVAPTAHRPSEPSIAFRFEWGDNSAVVTGDTVPCDGLDELCSGADALVHPVVRRDMIPARDSQRLQDVLDFHSSVDDAARTAERAGVGTLVLTHCVPGIEPGRIEEWRSLAAAHFSGRVELGDDLLRVVVEDRRSDVPQ